VRAIHVTDPSICFSGMAPSGSDFFPYGEEMPYGQEQGRLTRLSTARLAPVAATIMCKTALARRNAA